MAGIGRGIEEIKPNIAPLGVLIWDNEEVTPGTTTIIDTFGYTYLTLFAEVSRPATLILESVSCDGIHWRGVGNLVIGSFSRLGRAFINLNEVITAKQLLMYRFFKIRVDSAVPVKITLEVAGKPLDLLPTLQEIRDAVKRGFGMPVRAPIAKPPEESILPELKKITDELKEIHALLTRFHIPVPTAKPPEVPVLPELEQITSEVKELKDEVKEIHTFLTTQFSNADGWVADHKNVTTPGTPVQLSGLSVPDGFELVIKAKNSNTGNIYIANSKDAAQDSSKRITLEAKDSTALKIKKASGVWIDADNAGEGVEFWCEMLTGA